MRHLGRTHRVSVAWLHERFAELGLLLRYEMTPRQAADIYTEAFYEARKWIAACLLINIVDGTQLETLFRCFADHNVEQLAQITICSMKACTRVRIPSQTTWNTQLPPPSNVGGASQTLPVSQVLRKLLTTTFLTTMLQHSTIFRCTRRVSWTTKAPLLQQQRQYHSSKATACLRWMLKLPSASSKGLWLTAGTPPRSLTLGLHPRTASQDQALRHSELIMLINFHARRLLQT